jgi:hypothetical protein
VRAPGGLCLVSPRSAGQHTEGVPHRRRKDPGGGGARRLDRSRAKPNRGRSPPRTSAVSWIVRPEQLVRTPLLKDGVHPGWVRLLRHRRGIPVPPHHCSGGSPVTGLLPGALSSCVSGGSCTCGRLTGCGIAPPRKPSSTRSTCILPLLVSTDDWHRFSQNASKAWFSQEHAQ